jgi:signal transduction histidine kinase
MAHLFERFNRVPDSSRSVRGTGLGLYICRKIVEAHDGDIGVDSVPGRGTRFHFRIPLVPADVPEPQEEI